MRMKQQFDAVAAGPPRSVSRPLPVSSEKIQVNDSIERSKPRNRNHDNRGVMAEVVPVNWNQQQKKREKETSNRAQNSYFEFPGFSKTKQKKSSTPCPEK